MPSPAKPNSAQFSAVAEALRAFPKPVFTRWLRFRRNSADLFQPHWRKVEDKRRKVRLLDTSVAFFALMN